MKRFIALTASALCLAAAAHANPSIEVTVPADLTSTESAQSYTASLDSAVERVCRRAAGPLVGSAYYSFKSCVKQTTLDVAAQEPTGIYAQAKSIAPAITVAIR